MINRIIYKHSALLVPYSTCSRTFVNVTQLTWIDSIFYYIGLHVDLTIFNPLILTSYPTFAKAFPQIIREEKIMCTTNARFLIHCVFLR